MELVHHGLRIQLNDEWWAEAGMQDFSPMSTAYNVDPNAFDERPITDVKIEHIAPVHRAAGVPIFNSDSGSGLSARDRVVRILLGLRNGDLIPPVEIKAQPGENFPYRLTNGAHRLYCSLAAGFSHVPTVQGFEMSDLDR